jgi:hypothetical protein
MAGSWRTPHQAKVPKYRKQRGSRTFKGRETAIEDQFEVAKLSLGEDNRWESLSLGRELSMARSISCDQVLEDTTVGSVRHCVFVGICDVEVGYLKFKRVNDTSRRQRRRRQQSSKRARQDNGITGDRGTKVLL